MPTLAYIANYQTVTVIDTSSNTVVDFINLPLASGNNAYAVAITPDGRFAYVTATPNMVYVIDTSTNAIVASIAVGTHPIGIAITPNGRYAYVANWESASVSVIDTSRNRVVATIRVGSFPDSVAITPNGNFVYVTNSVSDNVSVIAISTNTVVRTIGVGDYPRGIAITPNGSTAYVANSNTGQFPENGTVSVIDTSTNTVVDTIVVGGGPYYIAITPDGNYAYVTNFDGYVSVIDTATNTVIQTITIRNGPIGIAITPDGNLAYVSNRDRFISVIDTNTNTVIDSIYVANSPLGIAIANIGPQTATETICIETTRIFDSCMFEDEQQKTFEFLNLNKDADIQCKILKTKYSILDITRTDEQQDLVNVKLQIKVLLGFTGKLINDNATNRVVSFERNITLTSPEDSDISCDINNVTCACNHTIGGGSSSCNYKLDCTVKVAAVVRSKKLVQIQIPFLGECTPRQCCPNAGMPMAPGTSCPLPNQPSRINRIKFTAKTNPGMTSRVVALLNGLPLAFATITEVQKAFELNLAGGPYPIANIRLINAGNSTIYIYSLTTE